MARRVLSSVACKAWRKVFRTPSFSNAIHHCGRSTRHMPWRNPELQLTEV
eukprot:jgi/Botrbrau1/11616/Bobra.0209s0007.1